MPIYAPLFGIRPATLAGALVAALHAARQDELVAWAFYSAAIAAFGSQSPLPQLQQAGVQRMQALTALVQGAGGLPAPAPLPAPALAPGWRATLERAMSGSIASAGLYQRLQSAAPVGSPAAQLFQRSQSELLTRHLPTLQRAWQAAADRERYHALQGIDPSQAYARHGLIGDAVEQLLALLSRQGGFFGLAGTILRAVHPALLAGALTGGAAVQGLRQVRATAPDASFWQAPHQKEN